MIDVLPVTIASKVLTFPELGFRCIEAMTTALLTSLLNSFTQESLLRKSGPAESGSHSNLLERPVGYFLITYHGPW
jgi:hypothetical protein